jgi:hypothetical protein
MVVSGRVDISLRLNVIDLETDAVEKDEYGRVIITDPDQFFVDWSEDWERGIGELLGATDEDVYLEAEDDEDEDEVE